MPIKTPTTKAGKAAVVKTEMHEFKKGDLHSGSKEGPVVHDPKQAVAIALSEAGESRGKPHAFDRPSAKPAQGYGHDATNRRGALRLSGHSGAHHIGKR